MKLFFFLSFLMVCQAATSQVNGFVLDESNNPLIGATITLLPDSSQTITNTVGEFTVQLNGDEEYELRISYIGFKTDTIFITPLTRNIQIKLSSDNSVLETIVVTEEHAKLEATLQTEHISHEFIQRNLEGNFAQTLEKIPGISAINVGIGIAKPVIRGLSSNRIIVNHQGIKQESQQWGSDHGLEIDQFDVERVEIIKGPGSLQYGSDGLGGVINILPDIILPKNSYKGSLLGIYKTNNNHWGGSAKLGVNIDDWFVTARYSRQDFADYRVPANLFNYNGFELPILNNRLKNTAGDESNISISTGLKRKWGVTRFLYSHYSLNAGLFSGAVGIPRTYALEDDGNSRDIDVPSQNVNHYRLSFNQTLFLGDDHLVFDIGLQRNHRQEFSEPEFHSIPLSQLTDPNDKLALQLVLETFSVASHYEHHDDERNAKTVFGFNTQWQHNQRSGFEYLLPDFSTFRGGIYSIVEKSVDNWLFNGGVRLDLGHNDTEFYRQFVWDSNENIVDSLVSPATDDLFFNWSASLGTNLSLFDEKLILKANLGRSFRVPYPAETVSNGIHHGTFRHEVGTPDLESEHGYQLDLGADWDYGKFNGNVSFYFNYFDNYIYLGPTFPAQFSTLPEAGQIFQYRQDDAIYTGFEVQWEYEFGSMLSLNQAVDYVHSYNPVTSLALPFTPQPSIRTDLNIVPFENNWIENAYLELSHAYHFAATGRRIDRSEKETPAYQLWGFSIGTDMIFNNQEVHIKGQVQNLLNTTYLSHLSRYRIIEVPEQGRNIVLTLEIPFRNSFQKKRATI